jgi:hypothetical protein
LGLPERLQQQQHELQGHPPSQQQQQQQQQEGAPGRLRVRWCRKQEHRFRRLDQVLIVGDNVVLVSSQPPLLAAAAAPR